MMTGTDFATTLRQMADPGVAFAQLAGGMVVLTVAMLACVVLIGMMVRR